MVANFIGRDRRPLGYNNSDTNLFAQPVIGDTEHGTFGDCVMFKNRAFDFGSKCFHHRAEPYPWRGRRYK